jgi:hypothetical protein
MSEWRDGRRAAGPQTAGYARYQGGVDTHLNALDANRDLPSADADGDSLRLGRRSGSSVAWDLKILEMPHDWSAASVAT